MSRDVFGGRGRLPPTPVEIEVREFTHWWQTQVNQAFISPNQLFAIGVLLQRRYFYASWRLGPGIHLPLLASYEQGFKRLEQLREQLELPLPPYLPSTPPPAPEPESAPAEFIVLPQDLT